MKKSLIYVALTFILAAFLSPAAQAASTGGGGDNDTLSRQDIRWMVKIAQGDIFEITLGQFAEKRATEHLAREFGERMENDHSRHLAALKVLAAKEGVKLPDHVSADQEVVLQYFMHSDSHDWDHDYVEYEVYDHAADIDATQKEIDEGTDADVKAFAVQTLPVLKAHWVLAKADDAALDH